MNNNQNNYDWNPNQQDPQKMNMQNDGSANSQMNMPNMLGANMQIPQGMMPYGMNSYMNQFQMGNMPQNSNMGGSMYSGNGGNINQEGSFIPNNNSQDQNQQVPDGTYGNQGQPAGTEEINQPNVPEQKVETQEQNPEKEGITGGEGRALDENALTRAIIPDSQPAHAKDQNGKTKKNVEENSKENDEDPEGKYNLRKRSRKEIPSYYDEFSDEENKPDRRHKKQKNEEEDYDPEQDEEDDNNPKNKFHQQDQNNFSGGQNQMDNYMMQQMMMQQMYNNSAMGEGMPNVNQISSNLNNMNNMMGSQYPQNQMAQQNFSNGGQSNTQVPQKSGGCGGAKEGPGGVCTHCNKPRPPPELLAQILALQNSRQTQMNQGYNDPYSYMMGGNSMMNGMSANNGYYGATGNTQGSNQNMNSGNNYAANNTQYPMQNSGNGGQGYPSQQESSKAQNNSNNQTGYGMMNGGNSGQPGGSGSNFDSNNFSASNTQMGSYPMMGGYQNMNQSTPGGGNGMNNGYSYGYSMYNSNGQNPQGNNQGMTPEQMQQMMQGNNQWMQDMNSRKNN
ncbi:unnamed protein product [Moneuplotes crassus]|uniref:Uncharacterized protein n=1 Tax=Euplotes crassus TaxID=5936 RepID=A0AAD1Y5M3_EUPCR|nr:unnamed protein product [Moneuplotes crassus]